MRKIITALFSAAYLFSANAAHAQVRVLAWARLDAMYHLTDMDCPVSGLESTRVATSIAITLDDDIARGCYEVDKDRNVVVIYWFEDDPKHPRRKRIPLSAFQFR